MEQAPGKIGGVQHGQAIRLPVTPEHGGFCAVDLLADLGEQVLRFLNLVAGHRAGESRIPGGAAKLRPGGLVTEAWKVSASVHADPRGSSIAVRRGLTAVLQHDAR